MEKNKKIPDMSVYLEISPDDVLENREIQGIPGSKLMKFAGIISPEDAELMLQAVEQDCRRVDIDEW